MFRFWCYQKGDSHNRNICLMHLATRVGARMRQGAIAPRPGTPPRGKVKHVTNPYQMEAYVNQLQAYPPIRELSSISGKSRSPILNRACWGRIARHPLKVGRKNKDPIKTGMSAVETQDLPRSRRALTAMSPTLVVIIRVIEREQKARLIKGHTYSMF